MLEVLKEALAYPASKWENYLKICDFPLPCLVTREGSEGNFSETDFHGLCLQLLALTQGSTRAGRQGHVHIKRKTKKLKNPQTCCSFATGSPAGDTYGGAKQVCLSVEAT